MMTGRVTERSHFFKSVVTFTGNKAQTMVVDVIKFTAGGFEKYIGDTRSDNMRPMNVRCYCSRH